MRERERERERGVERDFEQWREEKILKNGEKWMLKSGRIIRKEHEAIGNKEALATLEVVKEGL